MQHYESYKPSGIQWVEKIPSHWGAERAKWLFDRMERPVRPEDDVVTAFRDGQVTLRTNRRTEGFTNAIQEHGYQGIRKGDLVIHAMDAFAGAIGVSDSDGKSTPVYAACVPRGEYPVNSYYYAYLLRYMAHSGYIESLSKGIRERSTDFRFAEFRELPLPIPEQDEQDRIVAFLDQKTAEIDSAIAKKERLIEILTEQRQTLINQSVTAGLDQTVPQHYSGVEWIGDIPSGWGVAPVTKYTRSIVDYRGKTPEKVASGVFLVTAKNIKKGQIDYAASTEFVSEKDYPKIMARGLPEIGDLLFTTEAPLGEVALVDRTDVAFAQRIIKLRLDRDRLLPKFVVYAMSARYFQALLAREATGSTALGIKASKLHKLKIAAPSLGEQNRIVEYLDEAGAKIQEMQSRIQGEIENLRELKTNTVASCVTGLFKV